jgi:hypothetical protein
VRGKRRASRNLLDEDSGEDSEEGDEGDEDGEPDETDPAAKESDEEVSSGEDVCNRRDNKRERPDPDSDKENVPPSKKARTAAEVPVDQPLDPFDPDENMIETGDPLLLIWHSDRRWSAAVAKEGFDGDIDEIMVHHFVLDAQSHKLKKSWVAKSKLELYTRGGAAPEEQASDTKVARRVAFEDKVDVGMVALASDAAGLVNGFITQDQHNTLRGRLGLLSDENCFGPDGNCPLCQ